MISMDLQHKDNKSVQLKISSKAKMDRGRILKLKEIGYLLVKGVTVVLRIICGEEFNQIKVLGLISSNLKKM